MIKLCDELSLLAQNDIKVSVQVNQEPYCISGTTDSVIEMISDKWANSELIDIELVNDRLTLWIEKAEGQNETT